MALEYELFLIGTQAVEEVAARALPDPNERPTGTPPLLLSKNLPERYGFSLTVLGGENGYINVESDSGMSTFEPTIYASLTFYMEDLSEISQSHTNMLEIIRRLLDTGDEDALLVMDDDRLLLSRFDGALVKHNRAGWWAHYPAADGIIPG